MDPVRVRDPLTAIQKFGAVAAIEQPRVAANEGNEELKEENSSLNFEVDRSTGKLALYGDPQSNRSWR